MASEVASGDGLGSRRLRTAPKGLNLGAAAAGVAITSFERIEAQLPRRLQDESSGLTALKLPLRLDNDGDIQETSFFLSDDAPGVVPLGIAPQTPIQLAPPASRKGSLHHLSATSLLAHMVDEERRAAAKSPLLPPSESHSPSLAQETWWLPESRPASAQPSPTHFKGHNVRNSSASAQPGASYANFSSVRLRGMTASSAQTLHHSASYGDLRTSHRALPTNVYKPSRGPTATRDSTQSSLRREPFIPPFAEEARSSIRSAWTAQSSGFLGSDRSSVMTRASSPSDPNPTNPPMDDLVMSVEDAITMYAQGFSDDDDTESVGQDTEDELWSAQDSETSSPPNAMSKPRSESVGKADSFTTERTLVPPRSVPNYSLHTPPRSPLHQEMAMSKSPSRSHRSKNPPFGESPFDNDHHHDDEVVSVKQSPQLRIVQTSSFRSFDEPPPSFAAVPDDASTLTAHSQNSGTKDDGIQSPPASVEVEDTVQESEPAARPYLPLPARQEAPEEQISEKGDQAFTVSQVAPSKPVARDRYGFKKATAYITDEQYDEWNEGYTAYLDRRRIKWHALLKQYGLNTENPIRFPPKSERVKRYIRKGIPPEWRGAAWFWYAGGPDRLSKSVGLYWNLIEQVVRGKLSEADREHIERDLNRTFPDNIKYKPDGAPDTNVPEDPEYHVEGAADTPIVRSLRRVLQAFALHNPSIGYCQSLNFLAGMLLLFFPDDEEKAFTMLNVITSEHLPGTHAKILEANVDIGVLMMCIKESMPAVWEKINDNADEAGPKPKGSKGASLSRLPTVSLATTAWFMSCFIGNLPVECVLRVWDTFFYEGSKTLFRIALTIFKLGEPEIRAITDPMEIFQLVQTIPRRLIDANGLMIACYKKRSGFQYLSQDTVDERRVERRAALAEERSRKRGGSNAAQPAGAGDQRANTDISEDMKRIAGRSRMRRSLSRRSVSRRRPAKDRAGQG